MRACKKSPFQDRHHRWGEKIWKQYVKDITNI